MDRFSSFLSHFHKVGEGRMGVLCSFWDVVRLSYGYFEVNA